MGDSEEARKLAGTLPRQRERTAAEWATHRRQTARQRANAIAHVKHSRWIPNITYAQIQEIYDAKTAALAKVVAEGNYRRTLIANAKARALAEVKAMVAVLRTRQAAEQQALALAEAALREANPNYDEDALRKAMAESQVEGGERISAVEGLPVLPNAIAMNYPEPSPTVMAKQDPTLPALPDQADPPNPTEQTAQLKALRDFKKQQALQQVKQARQSASLQQQKISHREMEQRLQALLDQYAAGKISTTEYYERRNQIYRDGGVK